MWSKARKNSTNFSSIKLRQVRMVRFFYVKYSLFLVAEAVTGLIYHLDGNSSFQFSSLCSKEWLQLLKFCMQHEALTQGDVEG